MGAIDIVEIMQIILNYNSSDGGSASGYVGGSSSGSAGLFASAKNALGNGSSGDFGLIDMLSQADIVVKTVMILLAVFSIISWKIILSKYFSLSLLRFKIKGLEEKIWGESGPKRIYERIKHSANNIAKKIFVAGMYEFFESTTSLHRSGGHVRKNQLKKEDLQEKVMLTMESTKARELIELKKGLGMLATISSSSPFIGLFGTVWGIMNSFKSIAVSGNTSLAIVAPGIAEALFATAVGLFAAIPALIFYNKFNLDVSNINKNLDCLIDDVMIYVSDEFNKQNPHSEQN